MQNTNIINLESSSWKGQLDTETLMFSQTFKADEQITYHYSLEGKDAENFINAESKGKFFASVLRQKYSPEKEIH